MATQIGPSIAAQIQEMIEVKQQRIASWARIAGTLGDEDRALETAIEMATAGLKPLQQIAALPEDTQAQTLENLRRRGLTLDRLYDVVLFDDAAAAATRVKLRREQARLRTPWSDVWSRAELTNALGEHVGAQSFLAGKHIALLMAASWREGAPAFV